jgi:hypothetical protein
MNRWLEAAEILRHYKINGKGSGWSNSDIEKFNTKHVRDILYPVALGWKGSIGPWAGQNQPLFIALARMYLGVYMDDEVMFQNGYDKMFKPTIGTPTKTYTDFDGVKRTFKNMFNRVPVSLYDLSVGPNGEFMEINRDYGHMYMCTDAVFFMAEMLWHQDINMYEMIVNGDPSPRLVAGVKWLYDHQIENKPFWNTRLGQSKGNSAGQVILELRNGSHNMEAMYNHYKYRLNDKYQLTSLESAITLGRTRKPSSQWVHLSPALTHANLSKDIITAVSSEQDKIDSKLSIYPNPTSDIINIIGENMTKIIVLNALGEITNVYPVNGTEVKIDLSSQPSGVYFIQIQSGDRQAVRKIIKQ